MTPIEYRDPLPAIANTQPEAEAFWAACDDAHHERTQQANEARADDAHMCFPVTRDGGPFAAAFRESVALVRAVRGAA